MPLDRWQAEVRGLTIGAGTLYPPAGPVTGLLDLIPSSTDTERAPRDGAVIGLEYLPPRVIGIPLHVWATTDGSPYAGDPLILDDAPRRILRNLRDLLAAFAPGRDTAELELAIRLPGLNPYRTDDEEQLVYFGRPRGVVTDLTLLPSGEATALATFVATDPKGYDEVKGAGGWITNFDRATGGQVLGSIFQVQGSAPTDRVTITIENADAYDVTEVIIRNVTDADRIVWLGPIPAGDTITLDFHNRTITDQLGADRFDLLAGHGSQWWQLIPDGASIASSTYGESVLDLEVLPSATPFPAGNQDLTVDIDYRPAYY